MAESSSENGSAPLDGDGNQNPLCQFGVALETNRVASISRRGGQSVPGCLRQPSAKRNGQSGVTGEGLGKVARNLIRARALYNAARAEYDARGRAKQPLATPLQAGLSLK